MNMACFATGALSSGGSGTHAHGQTIAVLTPLITRTVSMTHASTRVEAMKDDDSFLRSH